SAAAGKCSGLRDQWPGVVRPARTASLPRPRFAESRRNYGRQQRSEGASTDGDLWLEYSKNGGSIHARCRPRAFGARRYAPAGIVRTKQHRIVSHCTIEWDFFGKKSSRIKGKFW